MPRLPLALLAAALLATAAASQTAPAAASQAPPVEAPPPDGAPPVEQAAHAVPFGSKGNAVEIEVAGLDVEPAEVVVTSAPAWLAFAAASAPAESGGSEAPVARLAFDVLRTAPVGEPAEVTVEVRAGGAVVATHTVRLRVAAPAALALGVPYPNPARGTVAVPFEVPEAGRVRLAAYDVLGREVAVLVDGERPAGGHSARLEVGALAAGVYVVRLVAGGQARAQRLTVAR